MIDKKNIELVYDVIDESANILYDEFKMDYVTGMVFSINNIMNDEVGQSVTHEIEEQLLSIYNKLENKKINSEEIRRAVQLCLLKGFKHRQIFNGDMTPDSIGFIFTFLIDKFYKEKELTIFDPLCGTSNLLATIANNLTKECRLIGCDFNEEMIKISESICNFMNLEIDLYFQNTLEVLSILPDVIVLDIANMYEEDKYITEEVILNHLDYLKEDKQMFILIPNDFFEKTSKDRIMNKAVIEGLIKLPNSIFKEGFEKSILILTKKGNFKPKEFLIAEINDFKNIDEVNKVMNKINNYIKNRLV